MRYMSIDVETTGLNPSMCQVIEISAVIDNLAKPEVPIHDLPTFTKIVYHDVYYFEKVAMQMHKKSGLLDILLDEKSEDGITIKELLLAFNSFVAANWGGDKIVPAGKNFGSFDRRFLEPLGFKFLHRQMDPTANYIQLDDKVPPALEACLVRAQLPPVDVAHRSLGDAQSVVALMRQGYSHLL